MQSFISPQLEWLLPKREEKITNVGKDVEKGILVHCSGT
jgi:protoheme ferro-lyase